jgi:hypothetical protein
VTRLRRSRTIDRASLRARVALLAMLFGAAISCCAATAAQAQTQPAPAPAFVLDGPTPDLGGPTGLGVSIARDGSGGAVYLKQAGGVAHVFVSRLSGGVFQAPVEVDTGLPGPSSQPVIAAGNGGLLLVAFINGGELYVADQLVDAGVFDAPKALAGGAINPAISITSLGKAYLAFAVADGAGEDVRTAYFWQGQWALEQPPLNANPGDRAGTGSGRPAVVAAGDGVAVVAWGESGGVFTRRVWATAPSTVVEQADGPLPGCTEVSADEPAVGSGGDSSFAAVAFREELSCGDSPRSRVLMNRLHGSAYDGVSEADGLSGDASEDATDPQLAVGEYGGGVLTSQRTGSHALVAADLNDGELLAGTTQVNAGEQATPTAAVPAFAGLNTRFVAWQQDPGASGVPDIRIRYAPGRDDLGPEMVLSSPLQGPANATSGLAADGDANGDVAVLWVQGTGGSHEIMVAQLYQPPGSFSVPHGRQYFRTSTPRLTWTTPRTTWGPLRYSVSIDGTLAIQTYSASARPRGPLADGPHSYEVTVSNPAGQQSRTGTGAVFVDTTAPTVSLRLPKSKLTGASARARVDYEDAPPAGSPLEDASGVATIIIRWGDGTGGRLARGAHSITHVYERAGRYTVTVTVTDKAGNLTRVEAHIKVTKPKPRPKGGHPPPGKRHR